MTPLRADTQSGGLANPFTVVADFEAALREYTGAPYAVTVDSCTNALFLALLYHRRHVSIVDPVVLPKRTYVGVAHAVRNAGFEPLWDDIDWEGWYRLGNTCVIDSAKRFTSGMFAMQDSEWPPTALICVSFQAYKTLPIGRGGAILTQDPSAAAWLTRARFDGRDSDLEDTGHEHGYHMYMTPPDAARGLWLLRGLPTHCPDLPNDHIDISGYRAFR